MPNPRIVPGSVSRADAWNQASSAIAGISVRVPLLGAGLGRCTLAEYGDAAADTRLASSNAVTI